MSLPDARGWLLFPQLLAALAAMPGAVAEGNVVALLAAWADKYTQIHGRPVDQLPHPAFLQPLFNISVQIDRFARMVLVCPRCKTHCDPSSPAS